MSDLSGFAVFSIFVSFVSFYTIINTLMYVLALHQKKRGKKIPNLIKLDIQQKIVIISFLILTILHVFIGMMFAGAKIASDQELQDKNVTMTFLVWIFAIAGSIFTFALQKIQSEILASTALVMSIFCFMFDFGIFVDFSMYR